MTLRIQDPADPQSEFLIDALLSACRGAQAGGGAFAFLSSGGVRLLLKDDSFAGFMSQGTFDFVVGVDAITNTAAVNELVAVQRLHPSLGARVLLPAHPRSIFHPKFAWFDHGDGGVLLTGSGNLTGGGLRWNVEAFAVQELNAMQMASLRGQWNAYLLRSAACLREPSDAQVVALLERNTAMSRAVRRAGFHIQGEAVAELAAAPVVEAPSLERPRVVQEPGIGAAEEAVDEVPPIGDATPALVAEIPRGTADGRIQANFSKQRFEDFFGASASAQRPCLLLQVRADGTLAGHEVRPPIFTQSTNFRLELGAGRGAIYPQEGRPIGLFVRVVTRTFLYMLLMPGDAGHTEVSALLDRSTRAGRNMRQIPFDVADVRAAWPASPLWRRFTL